MLRSKRTAAVVGLCILPVFIGLRPTMPERVRAAEPAVLTLEVDQATLTSEVNATLSGQTLGETPIGSASVDAVAVELRNGAMTIVGTVHAGWLAVPVDLTTSATAESGRVRIHVDGAHLGSLPIGDVVRGALEQALQDELTRGLDQEGIAVRSVTIGDGRLIVVGSLVGGQVPSQVPPAAPTATSLPAPTPITRPTDAPRLVRPADVPASAVPGTQPPLAPVVPLATPTAVPTFAPLPTSVAYPTFVLPDTPTGTPEDSVTPTLTEESTDTPSPTTTPLPSL